MRSFVLILVVLGLSISSVSHAGNPKDLKNPPPSKGESGHPKQKNPPSPEKPTQQDNRGTEDNPIVIKGIPSQKTSQEAAEDREDRNKKTALDQELNFYTGGQALFTALTFFAVSAQIGLFVWQLRLIKRSSIDTRESAKAALLTAQHMQTAVSWRFLIISAMPQSGLWGPVAFVIAARPRSMRHLRPFGTMRPVPRPCCRRWPGATGDSA